MEFLHRCWAEIDLDAIKYNLESYRRLLPEGTDIMCVVKASCYGHDDEMIAPFLQSRLGVRHFAVSNITEGERLRGLGIKGEILILGYTPPEYANELVKFDIIQACTEYEYACRLSQNASEGKVRVHIAVDTGMTRIGLHGSASENCDDIVKIAELENVAVEGIFTHYSSADGTDEDDDKYTEMQTARFFEVYDELRSRGVNLKHAHILNSAGGAYRTTERSTLARLGIILYGLYPNPEKPLPFEPKPVMTLKSVISQVKEIEAGTAVSYGRTFVSDKRIKLATITAGYADGYPRSLSNRGEVIIKGVRCRITGRVCMDQFMVDVSEVEGVQVGDEVILMDKTMTADELAKLTGTIGYEVVCGVSSRVPRVAVGG